jgi:putative FmdB family regulatory protein
MPVYEYYCPKCKEDFELMRSMSQVYEPALCPKCGKKSQRLVSASASKTGSYVRPPARSAFRQKP